MVNNAGTLSNPKLRKSPTLVVVKRPGAAESSGPKGQVQKFPIEVC